MRVSGASGTRLGGHKTSCREGGQCVTSQIVCASTGVGGLNIGRRNGGRLEGVSQLSASRKYIPSKDSKDQVSDLCPTVQFMQKKKPFGDRQKIDWPRQATIRMPRGIRARPTVFTVKRAAQGVVVNLGRGLRSGMRTESGGLRIG